MPDLLEFEEPIGPLLKDHEKWAIIEYLKVRNDDAEAKAEYRVPPACPAGATQ